MQITIPIYSIGPYSLAFVAGLLLYWNGSLIFSRGLTTFMATVVAMKVDLAFHLLYACLHHTVAIAFRLRNFWDSQDMLNHFQAHSQLYVIMDIGSIALLVGNTLQCWTAALITRVALSALATRAEIWMRRWESQSSVEHALVALACVTCMVGCTLQWAYYTLLPRSEMEEGGFASLFLWYTSIVYIVAVGARATSALATIVMRVFGYGLLQRFTDTHDRVVARALEDSGLNPYSEVHELYMSYFYAVVCAITAWYYAPSSLPAWIQCFVLLRLSFIATASKKLQRHKQVLDRFPLVSADPSKSCAICRDDFVAGEPVTCLPCRHTFHGACVRSWLMRAATCPSCRQPVAESAWRATTTVNGEAAAATPSRRTVARGVVVSGHLSGSVQPLAPRLHAGAARTRSALQRRPRTSDGVSSMPLPHASELARIEAKRQMLAERRERALSLPSSPAGVQPPPPVPTPPAWGVPRTVAPTAPTETQPPPPPPLTAQGGGGVDPMLFTDTPLASVEPMSDAAAPGTRRKRPRATTVAAVAGDGNSAEGEEGTATRQRTT